METRKKINAKNKRNSTRSVDAVIMKHPNRMMEFRKAIQEKARKQGQRISVDEFARAVGITTSYWRMLEHGQYDPREDLKMKISRMLEKSVDHTFPYRKKYSSKNKSQEVNKSRESILAEFNFVLDPELQVKPIWEIAEELIKEIPEEEWKKIPTDASTQLDHYLYGSPKKKL